MELQSVKTKNRKRVGRGISGGQGKTAGRGTKGQKSRAGFNIPSRFEGGQTPLSMRLAKLRGYKSGSVRFRVAKALIITLDDISKNYKDGEVVSLLTLVEKKLAKPGQKVKILNNGELTPKVSLGSDITTSTSVKGLFVVEETPKPVDENSKPKATKKSTPSNK